MPKNANTAMQNVCKAVVVVVVVTDITVVLDQDCTVKPSSLKVNLEHF